MKFQVIVADPPWSFNDSLKMSDVRRGAEANYDLMTMQEIRELPIKKYVSPAGCVLALWVPGSLLQDGMDTMNSWGFDQKQVYVWVKTKKDLSVLEIITKVIPKMGWGIGIKYLMNNLLGFGMGRLFRQSHEICLIGTSNNKIYQKLKNKSQRSVCLAPNLKHSSKPEELQDSLSLMFPRGKKLELFARRNREGWICLGNEICNGEDIRVSLAKLNTRHP